MALNRFEFLSIKTNLFSGFEINTIKIGKFFVLNPRLILSIKNDILQLIEHITVFIFKIKCLD